MPPTIHPKVYQVAKEQFRDDYERSFPMPVMGELPPKPTMSAFWKNPMVWVDLFINLSAGLMSALRTYHVLGTVGRSLEGFLGVIVIEGVAGFITFFGVLQVYKESVATGAPKVSNKIAGWMHALVGASIILALLTNIYSMMLYQDATLSAIEWLLFVFAGSIAVLAIGVLSHILGTLYVQNLAEREQSMQAYYQEVEQTQSIYHEAQAEWAQAMEEKWEKSKNRWVGMIAPIYQHQTEQVANAMSATQYTQPSSQATAMASVDRQTDRQTERHIGFVSGASVDKRMPEVQAIVYRHLQNNPADASLPARELAVIVGVGKDSANIARNRFIADNQANTNQEQE